MFRRPPDRKRKKYAHVNYENAPTCTNHFFFSLFFFAPLASYITSTVWIYTESQLSEYIHLFIKLPQQHRQISTKIRPRYPQISPVLRRKEYVCMEWWRPQSVILSVIILIIKAYHQVKKKKSRNKYIYNNVITLKCRLVVVSAAGLRRPACWRWSWPLWGWAWRRRSRWSCCCWPPECGPPDPAGSSGSPHSGWSRGGRSGCCERAKRRTEGNKV